MRVIDFTAKYRVLHRLDRMLRRSTLAIAACVAFLALTSCGIKGPLKLPSAKGGAASPEVTPTPAPLSAPVADPIAVPPAVVPPAPPSTPADKKQ